MRRRKFVGLIAAGSAAVAAAVLSNRSARNDRIRSAELFRIDVTAPRHFSHGSWTTRQHLLLHLRAGRHAGWSEVIATKNQSDPDLSSWYDTVRACFGKTPREALDWLRTHAYGQWEAKRVEWLELALWDLVGRQEGTPSVRALGLTNNQPVDALFTVLDPDPASLRGKLLGARARVPGGYRTVKVKLFGDPEADRELIRTARAVIGPDVYLIGDPNGGYQDYSTAELTEILIAHAVAGLNGCEDPAKPMTDAQYVELQTAVGELALIPDYPLRPTWDSLRTLRPGMGKIYNLHPKTAGSLADGAALIGKIQNWGSRVMIGDDSYIGPAATAWQQIACASGAVCVEALEKPEENDVFLKCIQRSATRLEADGRVRWEPAAGFGLAVDVGQLRKAADRVVVLRPEN